MKRTKLLPISCLIAMSMACGKDKKEDKTPPAAVIPDVLESVGTLEIPDAQGKFSFDSGNLIAKSRGGVVIVDPGTLTETRVSGVDTYIGRYFLGNDKKSLAVANDDFLYAYSIEDGQASLLQKYSWNTDGLKPVDLNQPHEETDESLSLSTQQRSISSAKLGDTRFAFSYGTNKTYLTLLNFKDMNSPSISAVEMPQGIATQLFHADQSTRRIFLTDEIDFKVLDLNQPNPVFQTQTLKNIESFLTSEAFTVIDGKFLVRVTFDHIQIFDMNDLSNPLAEVEHKVDKPSWSDTPIHFVGRKILIPELDGLAVWSIDDMKNPKLLGRTVRKDFLSDLIVVDDNTLAAVYHRRLEILKFKKP
ncbi:MAG TPA: hypothetical protein VE954_24645 [Oligoflexus sp.]|uniref:hypothetical protein n=1 Tax=Oligoflexus sp. TaxID=1971216 RepID=UPI002D614F4B|nr:hypothetical protein [Oligoflexus sp.]HYX36306.1 hypothetical protein [Oligoflexus sp.]